MIHPKTGTPNNFCPSRFSQVCPDFPFLLNANLYSVSRFTVQIALLTRKSTHVFGTDLRFGGKENGETHEKI